MESNGKVLNVTSAFENLRTDGEWLGARLALGIPPGSVFEESERHYQGIQRAPYHLGGPNNILYVTRSGPENGPNDSGFLAVIQLSTRDGKAVARTLRESSRSVGAVEYEENSLNKPMSLDYVARFVDTTRRVSSE